MVIALFHVNVLPPRNFISLSGYHVSTLCRMGVEERGNIEIYFLVL
jgi:hypothetical protein